MGGCSFAKYTQYALDVPMYFVYRDHKYIDASGLSFRVSATVWVTVRVLVSEFCSTVADQNLQLTHML